MLDFLRNIRNAAIGKVDVELEFREILKEINCHYDINEDEEHNVKRYYFDFQSGNFVAAFYNGVGVEVTFPNCFTVPVEEIDLLRLNCNRFNGSSLFHRYIYSTNEEENKLNLHISFFCDDLRRHLVNLLKACFQTQRDFIDEYNKVKERNGEEQNSLDPEHRFALDSRELFLIWRKLSVASEQSLADRIQIYLKMLSIERGGNDSVEVPFNRERMAEYFGVTRPALSRTLGQMRDDGLIAWRKNMFRINF